MILQSPDRSDDHNGIRPETGDTALDVEELLRTEIGGETRFRDHIIRQLQSRAGGGDGVAAMGDVGKGTAVNKSGSPLQRLDKVRLNGILQQRGHGAFRLQIVSGDRCAAIGVADDDAGETCLQIH